MLINSVSSMRPWGVLKLGRKKLLTKISVLRQHFFLRIFVIINHQNK
ncbi:hypothetical protein UC317_0174 [Lactococcus lactis subsp. lactis]|nr:hypothetical protein CVCAS_0241 [Lactococcus lactis subsp. lactis CV56]EHE93327.1 hypothetical protein LLCRE1631_01379 [Lactococcus lactis subsp. lactis CNCM I-1631]KSU28853.1 hypothetical protein NCDO895_1040 [Lactococcus lactis subsp. lactis]KSU30377.1 hypothetical protein ML8_0632 [Lactococcus lactis subsp. lactis]KSU33767.1 hypothetical protein UC317_0174 [Lactococcus lactis subsp. lactis]